MTYKPENRKSDDYLEHFLKLGGTAEKHKYYQRINLGTFSKPNYRYFYTKDEYQKYLNSKNKTNVVNTIKGKVSPDKILSALNNKFGTKTVSSLPNVVNKVKTKAASSKDIISNIKPDKKVVDKVKNVVDKVSSNKQAKIENAKQQIKKNIEKAVPIKQSDKLKKGVTNAVGTFKALANKLSQKTSNVKVEANIIEVDKKKSKTENQIKELSKRQKWLQDAIDTATRYANSLNADRKEYVDKIAKSKEKLETLTTNLTKSKNLLNSNAKDANKIADKIEKIDDKLLKYDNLLSFNKKKVDKFKRIVEIAFPKGSVIGYVSRELFSDKLISLYSDKLNKEAVKKGLISENELANYNELVKQRYTLQKDLDEILRNNTKLAEDIDKQQKNIDSEEKNIKDHEDQIQRIDRQIKDNETDIANYKNQLTDVENKRAQAETELEKLVTELEEMAERAKSLVHEPNPKSFKDLLKIDNKMSARDNMDYINPYYNFVFRKNGFGYITDFNTNCANCSAAYELRMRGYDVVADTTYKDDYDQKNYISNVTGWYEGTTKNNKEISKNLIKLGFPPEDARYIAACISDHDLQNGLKDANGNPIKEFNYKSADIAFSEAVRISKELNIPSATLYKAIYNVESYDIPNSSDNRNENVKTVCANIRQEISEMPNGARGQFLVFWTNGGGHSVVWEKVGNDVILRDCQTNQVLNLEDYVEYSNSVTFFRTDDKKLSNNILETCKNRSSDDTNSRKGDTYKEADSSVDDETIDDENKRKGAS